MKDLKTTSQLMNNLYDQEQERTKPEPQSQLSPEKARLIQMGLENLVSYGLLSDPSCIRDWANGLADMSEENLRAGFIKAKDYTGYLTLGDLRNMCRKPIQNGSYRRYQALPNNPLDGEEVHNRIARMKEKLGL